MSAKGRGRKTETGRGLPSVHHNSAVPRVPPRELDSLAKEFWLLVVSANPDVPKTRAVTLGLLCSQLAELSRLRRDDNAVDALRTINGRIEDLLDKFVGVELEPDERKNITEQRLLLTTLRDGALKKISAEQHLVHSITKLEDELGIKSVKVEDADKIELADIIDQGSYLGD